MEDQLVTDDNPAVEDETYNWEEPEEKEEQVEEQAEEQPEVKEEAGKEEAEPRQRPTFTPEQQEEMNQIIKERLSRERRKYEPLERELTEYKGKVQTLQTITGRDIDGILDYVNQNKVSKMVDDGIPEDEARRIVSTESESAQMKQELAQIRHEMEYTRQLAAYNADRSEDLNDPLIRKYLPEIDAFATSGDGVLGWKTAKKYVLGEKLPEILGTLRNTAEQKVLADVHKQSKVAPEGGTQAGGSVTQIPPEVRQWAATFGVSPKDAARQYERMLKEQRGR